MKTFGERLRALREGAGMSTKELAERIGTVFPYINKLERDEKGIPLPYRLKTIAQVFDVSVDYLLGGSRE